MAKHIVKCSICGHTFDANAEEYVKTSSNRYAHKSCFDNREDSKSQEQKDIEALETYIKKLFNTDYVNARIRKQIATYKKEYNYTYTGILKALIYFYEVKGNSIEQANGAIGIVPYIYQESFNYYYALWLANQQNETKNIQEYIPETVEIYITPPTTTTRRSKLFSFLDEEG